MDEYVGVLAGNYEQFLSHSEGFDGYVYIDRPEKLLGWRFKEIQIIGTFWDRKDARDIYREIELRCPELIDKES